MPLFSVFAALSVETESDTDAMNHIFTVGRFTTCKQIEEREPVGVTNHFFINDTTLEDNKIYAYLEANNIKKDTFVTFAWLFQGDEYSRYSLNIEKGYKRRTYAYKYLDATQKGEWEVQLLDDRGSLIASINYNIE